MKVLITGGHGQMGRALVRQLTRRGIDYVAASHGQLDIANESQVLSCISEITHIVNFAAYTQVDLAEKHQDEAYRVNVMGPMALAKIAWQRGIRLLHVSTDYIFDGMKEKAYAEEDEPRPLNVYGKTKREGELAVLSCHPDACIVRVSWVFGGGGPTDYAAKVLSALQREKTLCFVDDQISCPTYVFDAADACIALLDKCGIYHYCNKGFLSKHAFAFAIWEKARQADVPLVCQELTPISSSTLSLPAKRPLYTPLNTKKIGRLLSIRSWKEALEDLFARTTS